MDWHKFFIYNAETGDLIWKERPVSMFSSPAYANAWNAKCAGNVAGHSEANGGRVNVSFNGKKKRAHCIIWEMHYGSIPKGMEIDHADGLQGNNRLKNLRIATASQNQRNSKKPMNVHRVRGVVFNGFSWMGYIRVNNKRKYLGKFPTKGLAAVAVAKAELMHGGRFALSCRKIVSTQ